MTIQEIYQLFIGSDGITTDTRKLKKKTLFFALKGDNFNGNKYAESALVAGCTYAIVDEKGAITAELANDNRIILVDNVLTTLQNLANYHRKQFNIPIIGITGSNGKTTTKELAGAVLEKKYNVLITEGNLNNHLGVPFTLLRLNKSHQIAIIEMGANKLGDIKELVEIAEPTHGLITNIGAAHIEGFGSLNGVIKTKRELYDFIERTNGELFYNSEDETLKQILPKNITAFTYGEKGNVQGEILGQTPFISFLWSLKNVQSKTLETKLVGRYNFTNFLSAIAIGVYFDVEHNAINEAISNYTPSNNRSQVSKTKRNTLIVDCYNANATSMMAALESFVEMKSQSKLVVLGDMLELGDISASEHEKVIAFLEKNELEAILVGKEMCKVKTQFLQYDKWQNLKETEKLKGIKNTLVLLKGSRGIQLEKLIELL